jgi:hypothetical protein
VVLLEAPFAPGRIMDVMSLLGSHRLESGRESQLLARPSR